VLETKNNLNDDTIKEVQQLIEINIDSGKGFSEAAKKIENSAVARYFRECGSRREGYASELQQHVARSGTKPEDSGSLKGTMHRWWLDLRGTVQDGEEHAVLAEAERGEDAIKEKYEHVLKATSGSALNSVIQHQYASIKMDHDQIRSMRDTTK
jgi:uncharacterized protein (TIGR02284 family)